MRFQLNPICLKYLWFHLVQLCVLLFLFDNRFYLKSEYFHHNQNILNLLFYKKSHHLILQKIYLLIRYFLSNLKIHFFHKHIILQEHLLVIHVNFYLKYNQSYLQIHFLYLQMQDNDKLYSYIWYMIWHLKIFTNFI